MNRENPSFQALSFFGEVPMGEEVQEQEEGKAPESKPMQEDDQGLNG
ncbi:MAG: hypothetical protein JSV50_09315 [Desulfobacteraceae bacterium]|nr:MAG: hypothetical protein JSV50_09315 [Desulfobacteraceae bacterium]